LGTHQAKIAALGRGYIAKKRYQRYFLSVVIIQKKVRGIFQRKSIQILLQNVAAFVHVKIYSLFLSYVHSKRKRMFLSNRQKTSIVAIQDFVRKKQKEVSLIRTCKKHSEGIFHNKQRIVDQLKLRQMYIVFLWRRLIKTITMVFKKERKSMINSVKIIVKKISRDEIQRKKLWAITVLQMKIRYFLFQRREKNNVRKRERTKITSIKCIQRFWKKHRILFLWKRREEFIVKEFCIIRSEEQKLALILEICWTNYKSKQQNRENVRKKRIKLDNQKKRLKGILIIQRNWRLFSSCLIVHDLKTVRQKALQKEIEGLVTKRLMSKSVTKIQRVLRRHHNVHKQKLKLKIQCIKTIKLWLQYLHRKECFCLKWGSSKIIQRAYKSYRVSKLLQQLIRDELACNAADSKQHQQRLLKDIEKEKVQRREKKEHTATLIIQKNFRFYHGKREKNGDKIFLSKSCMKEEMMDDESSESNLNRKDLQLAKNVAKYAEHCSKRLFNLKKKSFHSFGHNIFSTRSNLLKVTGKGKPIEMNLLNQHTRFDQRIMYLMNFYMLEENEVLQLHDIFRHMEQHRKTCNKIDLDDFFYFIKEKKTSYGMWLINAIHREFPHFLTFSEFVHIISFCCLLGNEGVLKILFFSMSDRKQGDVTETKWIKFIHIMVGDDVMQFRLKFAIDAFTKFAQEVSINKGQEFKLKYAGFHKVSVLFSVLFNLFTIHLTISIYHVAI